VYPDLDSAFDFDTDPDPASQNEEDLDLQHNRYDMHFHASIK
jgi:hypothetical protein